jgi:hypothetical protein
MPLLFAEGRWNVSLAGPTPKDPLEALAHKAFRRQLAVLTHVELPTDEDLPVQLRVGQRWADTMPDSAFIVSPNGYRIRVEEKGITVVGGAPKGTLNGTYDLLERMGLSWPTAGADHKTLLPSKRVELPELDQTVAPSYPRITFFQDLRTLRDYSTDSSLAAIQEQNDRDLVIWMGRNRFTGLFGNLPDAPEPWDEAKRRGITRQFGGHILPRLLPRDLFEEFPDYFPMNEEGERFPGNVCASSPKALEVICRNALRFVEETQPEVLHLWGEDVLGGKWCACPDCRTMSVHDQYLHVVNTVADCLAQPYPDLKVAFIAYHDTLVPKLTGTPRPNVVLLFAPRQRCYRHALANPECVRNAEIYAGLQQYRDLFGPGRLHTFEYYGDALLWCSGAIVVPRLIVEDLKTYYQAGVSDSGCLMFGGYSWFSHPLNLFTFAKASWNVDRSAEEIVEEFVSRLFPGAEEAMHRYYQQLEDAARLLVERSDWFYRVPKNDVEAAATLLSDTEAAEQAWEALTETLNAALASGRPQAGESLLRERQALRFTQHLVRAYRHRIRAEAISPENESQPLTALQALQSADREIRSALRILHDLPPALCGSWGAAGNGEPRRLRQLLDDVIAPRIADLKREL